jgi:hypothetical protein
MFSAYLRMESSSETSGTATTNYKQKKQTNTKISEKAN